MSDLTWEFPVAVDLFFAGVGAGSFCLGAIVFTNRVMGIERQRLINFHAVRGAHDSMN